jgi:ketosteroid isomerase-like protein
MRSQRHKTIPLLLAAALVVAACGGDDADPATTSPATTTTTASATTTNVPAFSSDDALSVTDAYFEAYNARDVEAVLALFEPDATFSDSFGSQTRADWEQLLVWNAAQGTALSPPNCRVTAEVSGVAVTVSCPHNNLDALVQAVDGPPVPINLTLTVAPDGISDWVFIFGQPDFNTVGIPFDSWMTVNHPEDLEAVGFGTWTTVDEAEENGILTARYAAEWATYLNDNGCGYSDGC